MKKLLYYLKPLFPRMAGGLSIKFLGTIVDLFIPSILAYMIDTVAPQRSIPLILAWGGVMLVCSLLALIFNVMANRMASSVARDTTRAIRQDLYDKITSLTCQQVDEVGIPSLISRITSDTYNIHSRVGMVQRIGIRAPILLLGSIIMTLLLDARLALVLLATASCNRTSTGWCGSSGKMPPVSGSSKPFPKHSMKKNALKKSTARSPARN